MDANFIEIATIEGTESTLEHELYEEVELLNVSLEKSFRIVKIFVTGELSRSNTDDHLIVQLNGRVDSYRSYCAFNGDYGRGEWNIKGFYLTRGAWHDANTFSAEYTLSATGNRIMGNGLGTTSCLNLDYVMGCSGGGYLKDNRKIEKLRIAKVHGNRKISYQIRVIGILA